MLPQSIITIAVGAWFEKNLKVCFFEESHYSPTLLKVAQYLLRSISFSNFCGRIALLNEQKNLQLSHAFI